VKKTVFASFTTKRAAAAALSLVVVGGAGVFGPVEQLRIVGDVVQILRHGEYTWGGWHAEHVDGDSVTWLYDKRPLRWQSEGLYIVRHSSMTHVQEDTITSDLVLDFQNGEDVVLEFWAVDGDSVRRTSGTMTLHFARCDGSVPPGPSMMPDRVESEAYRAMIGKSRDLWWPHDEWWVTGAGTQHLWLDVGSWHVQVASWSRETKRWLPDSPAFKIVARQCASTEEGEEV
jgi:hypothetical protein